MHQLPEPIVLTARTYFWSPSGSASGRRSNEHRQQEIVAAWLQSLGLFVEHRDYGTVVGHNNLVHVEFFYRESCNNVYRKFQVWRVDGEKLIRSNITTLRKLTTTLQPV